MFVTEPDRARDPVLRTIHAPRGSGLDGPVQRLMHIVCATAPLHCAFDEIKMVDFFSRLAMHIDQMTL